MEFKKTVVLMFQRRGPGSLWLPLSFIFAMALFCRRGYHLHQLTNNIQVITSIKLVKKN